MKKKNYYWSVMIAFVMAIVSVGFVSCGDDDDPDGGGGNSALVGTWTKYERGGATSWYIGIRLNGNGSASYTEWDSKESPRWPSNSGKWIATETTLTVYEPDGDIMFSCQYSLSEDGQSLYLSGNRTYEGSYTKQ
ncbi:MAG: hypothetical protein IJ540_07875 [Prevotella sp.]|nr:hypothetical protein [Prevotella sp.]